MGRRKVVTSVNLDPKIYETGREEGYNFSKLLERAIREAGDPRKEIVYINAEIRYHENEINDLKEKLATFEEAENKFKQERLDDALKDYMDDYKVLGFVPSEIEIRLCDRLDMSPDELNEKFQERMASE